MSTSGKTQMWTFLGNKNKEAISEISAHTPFNKAANGHTDSLVGGFFTRKLIGENL